MRRSDRAKRLPARYSPSTANMNPPQKIDLLARYMSNLKDVSSMRETAAVKSSAAVSLPHKRPLEHPMECSLLSKYAKSDDPSIVAIFGSSPDMQASASAQSSQIKQLDVTGNIEPSKEPPSWIEKGPMEAKGAPDQSNSIASRLANRFGLPGNVGFDDKSLISQTATLPQSAYPVYDPIVEGACHPKNVTLRMLSPQKRKLIQQHLILLLHSHKCDREEVTQLPCLVPFCAVMKKVQIHMRACMYGYSCDAPFCASSRRIMCHWKYCKTVDCVVCTRLRIILMNKRKREQERLQALAQVPVDVKNIQVTPAVLNASPQQPPSQEVNVASSSDPAPPAHLASPVNPDVPSNSVPAINNAA